MRQSNPLAVWRRRAASHIAIAISGAATRADPWPYLFVENVLPVDVYSRVERAYEESALAFREQIHGGDPHLFFGSYGDRLEISVPRGLADLPPETSIYWRSLFSALKSRVVFEALYAKFRGSFRSRFGSSTDTKLISRALQKTLLITKHRENYYLGPHTDRYEKVVTLILNCAEREGLEHLGTTLYVPNKAGFKCRGLLHHNPKLFHPRITVPFRPNSALLFFRGNRTFHGVEPITRNDALHSERRTLQFNLWERRSNRDGGD